jgi:hypothetical protein
MVQIKQRWPARQKGSTIPGQIQALNFLRHIVTDMNQTRPSSQKGNPKKYLRKDHACADLLVSARSQNNNIIRRPMQSGSDTRQSKQYMNRQQADASPTTFNR